MITFYIFSENCSLYFDHNSQKCLTCLLDYVVWILFALIRYQSICTDVSRGCIHNPYPLEALTMVHGRIEAVYPLWCSLMGARGCIYTMYSIHLLEHDRSEVAVAVCPPRRPGVDWTQELRLHLKWHHPGTSQERDINFPRQPTLCALEPCCLCHRIPISIYNPTKNTEKI